MLIEDQWDVILESGLKNQEKVNIWFDLMMSWDSNGRRFESFTRDRPYELSAGAYFDLPDGPEYRIRLQKSVQCFDNQPFDRVRSILETELEKYLPVILTWDEEFLREQGQLIQRLI